MKNKWYGKTILEQKLFMKILILLIGSAIIIPAIIMLIYTFIHLWRIGYPG
jgi:hypothetical protein